MRVLILTLYHAIFSWTYFCKLFCFFTFRRGSGWKLNYYYDQSSGKRMITTRYILLWIKHTHTHSARICMCVYVMTEISLLNCYWFILIFATVSLRESHDATSTEFISLYHHGFSIFMKCSLFIFCCYYWWWRGGAGGPVKRGEEAGSVCNRLIISCDDCYFKRENCTDMYYKTTS